MKVAKQGPVGRKYFLIGGLMMLQPADVVCFISACGLAFHLEIGH
jgi:hypothetical protein